MKLCSIPGLRSTRKAESRPGFVKGKKVNNAALLSVQKNEGPFLLEFVSHHIAVGFRNILLVTNPSDDWTNELAQALAECDHVRHLCVETPVGVKPQEFAFSAARASLGLDGFDWLLILDGDEMLNIHTGNGLIEQFLMRFEDAVDVVSINMACFGNHPHVTWAPTDSSSRFLNRLVSAHGRNAPSKSWIHHPKNFDKFKPHGPSGFRLNRPARIALHGGLKFVEVDGTDPDFYSRLRSTGSSSDVHSIAQINHYVVRTYDSFLIRAARGRGNAPNQNVNNRHTEDFFLAYSKARFLDDSIIKYREKMNNVRTNLLENSSVAMYHEKAIERYREKISLLRE